MSTKTGREILLVILTLKPSIGATMCADPFYSPEERRLIGNKEGIPQKVLRYALKIYEGKGV